MKKSLIIILLLACVLLSSCINTHPEPLIGAYRFDDTSAALSSQYLLRLYSDGKFALIMAGGENGDTPYVFEGTYTTVLKQFNFLKAAGEINMTITENDVPSHVQKLPVSLITPNLYSFYWECDKDKGPQLLQIKSRNTGICEDIGDGYPIPESVFDKELEKLKGTV